MRLLFAWFVLVSPLVFAAPITPKPDSEQYRDILAAVIDPVEDAVHQPVTLKVKHLKVENGWAFLDALPVTKAGKPIDYRGTMYQDWVDETDEVLWVLLRYKRDRWYIVEKIFFTAEATWTEWPQYFRAPPGIFPKLEFE